jgi:tRNA(Ile)-lysidine synthetase-like protein
MAGRSQIAASDARRSATVLPIAARRHALVREVDRQLARCGLTFNAESIEPTRLVVAVSGGADSTALLLACVALSRRKRRRSARMSITAAHVHHHLRDAADADARHVAEVCERFGVPLQVKHVQPGELKGNVAANARRLRYQALAEVAGNVGAKHVAVAHHAEDQLETMLMAMCRGAGARGLAAMRPARRINGVTIVRPLLGVLKCDCEDLCRCAAVAWREDASNRDATRRRARLRRDVTPILEQLWPGAARRAAACAKIIAKLADTQESGPRRKGNRSARTLEPDAG